MSLFAGRKVFVQFHINATDLSAGTAQEIVSPVDGYIEELQTVVQVAIVTGGVITAEIATVAVTGLSVTIADAAAKGSIVVDTATPSTSTRKVTKGQRITVTPSAAFNGGGEVKGMLIINDSQDVTPAVGY